MCVYIYLSQKRIWLLPPNEALVLAKREIDHAPAVNEDPDLYAPIFRNISVFKRYLDFFYYAHLFSFLLLNCVMNCWCYLLIYLNFFRGLNKKGKCPLK